MFGGVLQLKFLQFVIIPDAKLLKAFGYWKKRFDIGGIDIQIGVQELFGVGRGTIGCSGMDNGVIVGWLCRTVGESH